MALNNWLNSHKSYRFQLRWGLMGCLALVLVAIITGPYSEHIEFLPDETRGWYYWQLPEPSTWAFITAWVGYAAHQLFHWWIIFRARQAHHKEGMGYTSGLHPINVLALVGNAFFIGLHILQTKLFYDGLAQTVSVWSSQFSVIFLLVVVLIMENPRRGLFFGKRVPIKQTVVTCLKRYHGYYFSWAILYTFWYHPIELTPGHLLGFFYLFALLLQGSLMFTRSHRNRYWTVFLESFVLIHGVVVAYLSPLQGWSAVAMFFTGFLSMLVVTQIHGLGLSQRVVGSIIIGYVLVLLGLIGSGVMSWQQPLRIPFGEYGLVLIVSLLLWGALALIARGRVQLRTETG
ncbi:hypothetical protein [Microbulbifer pacificus]|uniref:Serine active site containing 1-like protein n=1 Tax=Microbulbifer pacificus TaxID=407164 RepID=A0AAU0N4T8_9GAMM|nr:hypothetical protein [Microbulbifer pacificus]WOX06606.1 hypothetical protein R5R33_05590 [Microbulbifer pacificus]